MLVVEHGIAGACKAIDIVCVLLALECIGQQENINIGSQVQKSTRHAYAYKRGFKCSQLSYLDTACLRQSWGFEYIHT